MAATHTSTQSGLWSNAATWGGSAPADGDTVIIAAGHTVEADADLSGWTTGISSLVIQSHATTPGMLVASLTTPSVVLPIKAATNVYGTSTGATKGRILANSDKVWGNTGAYPVNRKFAISFLGTNAGQLDCTYLSVAMIPTEPTVPYLTVYGAIDTVDSVDVGTSTLTAASHGLTDGTAIVFVGTDLPAPLEADYVYYVRDKTTDTFKVAEVSSGVAVTLTDAGSGTQRFMTGHSSTSTDHLNVLEDVTADAHWAVGSALVLVNALTPVARDAQFVTLDAVDSASVVDISANVDSAQYPGARLYLAVRNVAIRSAATSNTLNLVVAGSVNRYGEIRNTAATATAYWARALSSASGGTASLIVGCQYGLMYGGGCSATLIIGCGSAIYQGAAHAATTIAGCATGISNTSTDCVVGSILGCDSGVSSGTNPTVTRIQGCTYGLNNPVSATVDTICGCTVGVLYGTSCYVTAVTGCGSGMQHGALNNAGLVRGCINGCMYGTNSLRGTVFSVNYRDLYLTCARGYGASLNSATQNGAYKHVTVAMPERRFDATCFDLNGVAGAIGCWTQGGFVKSATYASGTHGTPPVATDLVHEQTFEDSDRVCYVELPLHAAKGHQLTVQVHGKLTGTSAWTTRPNFQIVDPNGVWQSDALVQSAVMAANTDWQSFTLTYEATADKELYLRVQGVGGNAGGTGTEKLYWFVEGVEAVPTTLAANIAALFDGTGVVSVKSISAINEDGDAVTFGSSHNDGVGLKVYGAIGSQILGLAGDSLEVWSMGSNGNGLSVVGNGIGAGLIGAGGASGGNGIQLQGNAGIYAVGDTYGIYAEGDTYGIAGIGTDTPVSVGIYGESPHAGIEGKGLDFGIVARADGGGVSETPAGLIAIGYGATGAFPRAVTFDGDTVFDGNTSADAVSVISDAVWDEARADHNTENTFGEWVRTGMSTSDIATGVWSHELPHATYGGTDERAGTYVHNIQQNALGANSGATHILTDLDTVHGLVDTAIAAIPTVGAIADAVWDEDIASGHTTEDSAAVHVTTMYSTGALEATVGNVASAVSDLHTDIGTVLSNLATVDTVVDTIHSDLDIAYSDIENIGEILTDIHDTDLPLVKVDTDLIRKINTNKREVTASAQTIYDDDDTTVVVAQSLSSSPTLYRRGKNSQP